MALAEWIWGKSSACKCKSNGDHLAGKCPDGCTCSRCACTCVGLCHGGDLTKRFGNCHCGCVHHGKSSW